jgi:hypothetical protein
MPERTLVDVAAENLRRYFPNSAYVKKLNEKLAASSKPISVQCTQRACPWPLLRDGLCRQHALDAVAERSTMPCGLGPIITELHGPQFHPAPSR